MSGNNYNKRSGQVLLIIVLLLAVLLTVVLSLSFTAKTETQLTKLEEDNQKALAAAEAGIEAEINQKVGVAPVAINTLPGLGNFSGQVSVSGTSGITFLTPLILPNQQYTFYLVDYNDGKFYNKPPYSGTVNIHYGLKAGDCDSMALEITVLSGDQAPFTISRWVADTSKTLGSTVNNIGEKNTQTKDGVTFYCDLTDQDNGGNGIHGIKKINNARLMLVRNVNGKSINTQLDFEGTDANNNRCLKGTTAGLCPQGKYVQSTATTQTGVTKQVQLFQSYPQLPAEFFPTSF